jgi:thymidine kinase
VRSLVPFTNATSTLFIGSAKSKKTTTLERLIASGFGGGVLTLENAVIVKHPNDDFGSPMIGNYEAVVTSSADEVAALIRLETKQVFISGIGFFKDSEIVPLLDALVRTGRNVTSTSLNLTSDNLPPNYLPEIMAHSDFIQVINGICMTSGCARKAYRSQFDGTTSEPRCLPHHEFEGRPNHNPFLIDQVGFIKLYVTTMFGSKTRLMNEEIREAVASEIEHVVFVELESAKRYSQRDADIKPLGPALIPMNDAKTVIEGIAVRDADDIQKYLDQNGHVRWLFFDELQFIPGAEVLLPRLALQGYGIIGTGIYKTFDNQSFNNLPMLMCYATELDTSPRAYCKTCGHPATHNQRWKLDEGVWKPSSYGEERKAIAGDEKDTEVEHRYASVCLPCHELGNRPISVFERIL